MKLEPINWMNEIWASELHPYSKLIAAFLRSHMHNNKNNAHPSYGRMVKRTGLSKSTLAKYMTSLESLGWIKRIKGNSNTPTRYYISLPTETVKELGEQLKAVANNEQSESVLLGSASDGLRENDANVVRETDKGSACDGTRVVRETDSKKQVKKQKKKQVRFTPPTIEEVQKYLDEKNITSFTAERFHAHYEASNWIRGKNTKIKNWKACVTTWTSNNQTGSQNGKRQSPIPTGKDNGQYVGGLHDD